MLTDRKAVFCIAAAHNLGYCHRW